MTHSTNLVSLDNNGEFVYHNLNSHIAKKYKPDTPLDKSFVPYLIMFLCATIDATCFIQLFTAISYDSVILLAIQTAGLLFSFDLVPLYLGIQLRRIRQGLSKDKFLIWLALIVCVLAVLLNVILRIMTMEQISPSQSATNYYGSMVQESQTDNTDTTSIALTIFGCILPILTSVGSFFISYLTYNPLKVRKRLEEEMLNIKKDEIRRLDAIIYEYDIDTNFAEHLVNDDTAKYNEIKKRQRAMVLTYCDYVRLRLKEHLANPSAISALSEETCIAILERLDRELAAFDKIETYDVYEKTNSEEDLKHTYSKAVA